MSWSYFVFTNVKHLKQAIDWLRTVHISLMRLKYTKNLIKCGFINIHAALIFKVRLTLEIKYQQINIIRSSFITKNSKVTKLKHHKAV